MHHTIRRHGFGEQEPTELGVKHVVEAAVKARKDEVEGGQDLVLERRTCFDLSTPVRCRPDLAHQRSVLVRRPVSFAPDEQLGHGAQVAGV